MLANKLQLKSGVIAAALVCGVLTPGCVQNSVAPASAPAAPVPPAAGAPVEEEAAGAQLASTLPGLVDLIVTDIQETPSGLRVIVKNIGPRALFGTVEVAVGIVRGEAGGLLQDPVYASGGSRYSYLNPGASLAIDTAHPQAFDPEAGFFPAPWYAAFVDPKGLLAETNEGNNHSRPFGG